MLQALNGQGHRDDGDVPVESVGQAAAGGLLVAVAAVELALGFWAAGWQHRAVALAVACVGIAFLLSGLAQIVVVRRAGSGLIGLAASSEGQ